MRYLLLASFALLFSCSASKKVANGTAGKPGQDAAPFEYTTWELTAIPDFELEKTSKKVTLIFLDSTKRIGGYAGCNGYGGNYTKSGNSIRLENIISTKMACMPGMKTENKFISAMMETDSYELSGEILKLKKDGRVLAELKKAEK